MVFRRGDIVRAVAPLSNARNLGELDPLLPMPQHAGAIGLVVSTLGRNFVTVQNPAVGWTVNTEPLKLERLGSVSARGRTTVRVAIGGAPNVIYHSYLPTSAERRMAGFVSWYATQVVEG